MVLALPLAKSDSLVDLMIYHDYNINHSRWAWDSVRALLTLRDSCSYLSPTFTTAGRDPRQVWIDHYQTWP